jgi:hypothetical protein
LPFAIIGTGTIRVQSLISSYTWFRMTIDSLERSAARHAMINVSLLTAVHVSRQATESEASYLLEYSTTLKSWRARRFELELHKSNMISVCQLLVASLLSRVDWTR